MARKKDGNLCLCIDLRKFNACMIKDAYSPSRIDKSLDCLNETQIFLSLDLMSGYWLVELSEESKQLIAFIMGSLGFYKYERMQFGLTNTQATFQRLMETFFRDLHLNCCIIYLEDIIIFSKTPEDHIQCLRGVFEKLAQAGLKLKPSKCAIFKTHVSHLGHVASHEGIETDLKKIVCSSKLAPTSHSD